MDRDDDGEEKEGRRRKKREVASTREKMLCSCFIDSLQSSRQATYKAKR
jgi:hypothetical protein